MCQKSADATNDCDDDEWNVHDSFFNVKVIIVVIEL